MAKATKTAKRKKAGKATRKSKAKAKAKTKAKAKVKAKAKAKTKAKPKAKAAKKTKAKAKPKPKPAPAEAPPEAVPSLPEPVAEISRDEIVLTPDGYQRIQQELHELMTVQRPQIMAQLREARQAVQSAEEADTSEYENAKMEQARIEGRIQELRSILLRSRVLEPDQIPTTHVGLGSKVRVKNTQTGAILEFTIVGPVEADPELNKISNESPVGRALMGRKARSEVKVDTPGGSVTFRILKISK